MGVVVSKYYSKHSNFVFLLTLFLTTPKVGSAEPIMTSQKPQSPVVTIHEYGKSNITYNNNYNIKRDKKAKELVAAAKNFEIQKDFERMLEFSKKSYTEDYSYPDVIYLYSYALAATGKEKQARELLIQHQHALGDKEKALLGCFEFNAKHFEQAFQLLKGLDLARLPESIERQSLTCYAISALQVLPYQDALTHVQKAIMFIEKKKAFYSVGKMTPTLRDDRTVELSISLEPIIKLGIAEFDIAFALIGYLEKSKDIKNEINFIQLANNGFTLGFGILKEDKLLNYLHWFNLVLANHNLVKNNEKLIGYSLKKYIEAFSNVNDKTDSFIKQKLKILSNIVADKYGMTIDKYDVKVTSPIEFNINGLVQYANGLQSIEVNYGNNVEKLMLQNLPKEVLVDRKFDIPLGDYPKERRYEVVIKAIDVAGNETIITPLPTLF
jgi:hypothetical protein